MLDILNPTKRKALYGIFGAAAVILVTLGFAPKVTVDNWVEVAVQVVGLLALVLSSIKAKRADYTAIYGGAAALVGALTAAGIWNDSTASQIYDVMAQVAIALPLLVAFVRTDSSVSTGEPASEYIAKHAVLGVVEPRNEAGALDARVAYVLAAAVVIVLILVWLL